jgi:hypothetical protein
MSNSPDPYDVWAWKWQLPPQAIQELMEITAARCEPLSDLSEEAVASECRLELAKHGIISMRNNVGALQDATGRVVRYGLMNETPSMNKAIKSSDDILLIPYVVKPQDVGRTLGLFGGSEYKERKWVFTGKGRENAQANFHRLLGGKGAFGTFANSREALVDSLVKHGLISL